MKDCDCPRCIESFESEYVDTPYSQSYFDDLQERVRRYNQPSQDAEVDKHQPPPSPPSEAQKASISSSSGETLVPNSQEADLGSGEQVVSPLVVLDTPDRVRSVQPKLSPQSKKPHQSWTRRPRRKILPRCDVSPSSVEHDTNTECPDSYIDANLIRRFRPSLVEKQPRNSHSKFFPCNLVIH